MTLPGPGAAPARSESLTDTPPIPDPSPVIPLPAVFDRYREEVGLALRASLSGDDSPIRRMLAYAMGWVDAEGVPTLATEGKALRPTLCLLACEATGGVSADAMPAAVALELVHNFSLIHDEIQDRDDVRRHRPTLWTVWGERKALVAGNVMRILADMALWGHQDRETALAVAELVTQANLEMIEGQYMDLHFEGRMDITLDDYLAMISRKTGALIRCSLVAGAAAGSGDPAIIEAFEESGKAFGMVFQVRDDYLGVWGVESATGKPVGADIRRKKNAFPFVYAMSKGHRGRPRGSPGDLRPAGGRGRGRGSGTRHNGAARRKGERPGAGQAPLREGCRGPAEHRAHIRGEAGHRGGVALPSRARPLIGPGHGGGGPSVWEARTGSMSPLAPLDSGPVSGYGTGLRRNHHGLVKATYGYEDGLPIVST